MFQKSRLVLIGKITGTHGIKGQLRVVPYSGDSNSILSQSSLILTGAEGESDVFKVAYSSIHGKKVLITLESYDGINQVEHLVGREVYVKREQLPELPDGEYYWCDLIGLKVITTKGECLGKLRDIFTAGNNDVYMVKDGDREYLIPAVEDIVTDINLIEGVMTVDPPEGLLDL
jgi:16S rRNA processing protein RimM